MARRSFSFMLAWRYLNPRRAMLSAVTIISVLGVLLGVWVLVVVMSVFNGLEDQVRNRLLGYAPHIRFEQITPDHMRIPITDWREMTEELAKNPNVESAAPYLEDYAVVEVGGRQKPYLFRGVDSLNPAQIEGLDGMLDKKKHPDGNAEMGLAKKVVVSSNLARDLDVTVGDQIKVYSTRNLQQVKQPYDIINFPPVRERYKEDFAAMKEVMTSKTKKQGDKVLIPEAEYQRLMPLGEHFQNDYATLRTPESDLLNDVFGILAEQEKINEGRLISAEGAAKAVEDLDQLEKGDVDQMDLATLKGIRELILPQEVTICGIFEPGKMMVMPELFMPLNVAQQLSGLEDSVQAVGVRLKDSYAAERIADEMLSNMPRGWVASTWYSEFRGFAQLINQQRIMMYIVLSLITIISAFSMMAVMLTVTIQKRREIGVMKALGAAPGQIVRVFVYQGVILGAVGALVGVGVGLGFLRMVGKVQEFLRPFGIDPFPADFNGFDTLPYIVVPHEVISISVSAFILCSVAALVPAFFAARNDAAKSLRNL